MMDRRAFIINSARIAPLAVFPATAMATAPEHPTSEETVDQLISNLKAAVQASAPDGYEIRAIHIHHDSFGFIARNGDNAAVCWSGGEWTIT